VSRASRARKIAAAAAFGGGGLGAIGAAVYGLLLTEIKMAKRVIGRPFGQEGPGGDGVYGSGPGDPIVLGFLGDSSSLGLGADYPAQTPGAVLAGGLAAISGRPVQLRQIGRVGARSSELDGQAIRLLAEFDGKVDAVVVMVGANDVSNRTPPAVAVRELDAAVRRLREAGTEVVVGTCPDLGTIDPIPYPLRYIARRSSRELAAAQTIAVVEAGARSVSLGDLLGPEFAARPKEMFSSDRFHPSAAGYARAAAAMLPSVAAALSYWPEETERHPDVRRGEGVDDIAHAAARAVASAGTEVSGAEISGAERGPHGRWALLRRWRPSAHLEDGGHERIEPSGETGDPADSAADSPPAATNGQVRADDEGGGGGPEGASGATVATTTSD
jgi:lysophospholipase L1-like esterase